jgi:hypothetical protein
MATHVTEKEVGDLVGKDLESIIATISNDQSSLNAVPKLSETKPSLATTDQRTTPTSIENLPNELLGAIFGYLDGPKPSVILCDEPTFEVTDSENTDLKAVSRVSKGWRETAFPVLFRHSRFTIRKSRSSVDLKAAIQPFLTFVMKNSLRSYITSFVLLVEDRNITASSDGSNRLDGFPGFWDLLFQTIDPSDLLIVAHPQALGALTSCTVHVEDVWNFDFPCHYLRLEQPSDSFVTLDITSPTLESHDDVARDQLPELNEPVATPIVHDTSSDVSQKPPSSESSDSMSGVQEESIEVKSDPLQKSYEAESSSDALPSALFQIRPWSTLLLNEGSFVKAYSSYAFWERIAPSVSTRSPQERYLSNTPISDPIRPRRSRRAAQEGPH